MNVQGIYSFQLTTNSPMYTRECIQSNHYYETIQINVIEDGYYRFGSINDSIYTYGDIYENKFNPFDPHMNQINKNIWGTCRFGFEPPPATYLRKQMTYILVVTTDRPRVTGSFSIIVFGPNNVTLKHSGEYTILKLIK